MTLKLPNPDGSGDIIDIRCLRSPEWLAETGAESGGWILFGLPEIGVVGPAYVVTVEPCPPVEAGPGRVVLATVTHYNSFVLRLWVAGLDEPLEPTAEHPLYSEDRRAWVPAGELCVGELLRTAAGPAAVAAVERRPGTHRVYNLEVEGEHCYFVGASGVLSHNVLGCILRIGAQYGLGELTAGISEATGVPEELVQLGLGGVVRGAGKVRARSGTRALVGGETPAAARGRQAHKDYKWGEGWEKEQRLPSGKRPDAINWDEHRVGELKPDNPRARARGKRQVEGYRQKLEDMTGEPWEGEVRVY